MNIVKITAESLTLSSGLSQDSFAKTRLIDLLAKKSRLVHIENKSITAEDYVFSGTKAGQDGITLFEGPALQGKILSDILSLPQNERTEEDLFSISAFSQATDYLFRQEEELEAVGAGGIVIKADAKTSSADILFINPELFEICAQNHKESYIELQEKYLYKGLDAHSSLLFTRAVAAYRAITGHFPFENEDTSKRQEDIFDSNFIPLFLWNPAVDEGLCESIHASLSLKVKSEVTAGKRNLVDAGAEQKRRERLKKALQFNSEDFFKEITKDTNSDNQKTEEENKTLAEKRAAFISTARKKLAVKRFFRRNKNRILVSLATVLFLSWWASGFIHENQKLLTTKGLTSEQTAALMYTMIHKLDVPNFQEIIKGKESKDLMVKVSGLFVSSKERLQVSPDLGTVRPEQWFFYKKTSKNWMMGITNLYIDGKPVNVISGFRQKRDNPLPITEENGKVLKKGDESTHKAEYYFVNQAEAKFYIEKTIDTVTLRWNGSQWNVVKVEGKAKTESVKSKDFINEYYALIGDEEFAEDSDGKNRTEGNTSRVKRATDIMREKYPWIPRENDIRYAAETLFNEYGSIEAEKYLKSK